MSGLTTTIGVVRIVIYPDMRPGYVQARANDNLLGSGSSVAEALRDLARRLDNIAAAEAADRIARELAPSLRGGSP